MNELWKRHPVTVSLAAIAAVLLAIIGLETGWGTQVRPPLRSREPVRAAALEAKLLPPVIATPAEQAYPETGSRPLFTPTRRAAPPGAAAGSLAKGQYTLHGVTIVGDLRIAFLKDKSSGKTLRAERGREVNGITVAEVERDKVTLRVGEDVEVLPLSVQKAGQPGTSVAQQSGPFAGPPASAATAPPAAPGSPEPSTPGAAPTAPTAPRGTSPGSARSPSASGGGATQAPAQRASPQGTPGNATPGYTFEDEALARLRARRAQRANQ